MGNKFGDIRYKWLDEKGFNVLKDTYQHEYAKSLFADVKDVKTIFVNAKAGTGKTTIATLIGAYGVMNGDYDRLIYIRSAVPVRDLGFLPGGLGGVEGKEAPFMQPFIEALDKVEPGLYEKWIAEESNPKVIATTTAHLRGVNFERAFVILDECQNYNLIELQTVMTRPHDDCKTVAIGSTAQNDDGDNLICGYTPFELYEMHFEQKEYSRNHVLVTNFRGDVSKHSDEIGNFIKILKDKQRKERLLKN